VLVALGGNALLQRGQPFTAEAQRTNARVAATALARLAMTNRLVVTHGNGPQVGLLALQSESDPTLARFPLDVLDAESEGMIGYVLDQELTNEIAPRGVATLLTQVKVAPDDPAFLRPTKPIGPTYDEHTARHLAAHRGWFIGLDGDGFRRLVPSPAPLGVVELTTIRLLLEHNVVVICGGGGGIPVVQTEHGLVGVEAVIDKDATAALLAEEVADVLVLLTDVAAVYDGYGTGDSVAIRLASPARMRQLDLAAGSMGPKVEAACRFVEHTGRPAVIGALDDADAVVAGTSGTWITRAGAPAEVLL
jgi:carbamate kinase